MVVRRVASNTRAPRFESGLWQFFDRAFNYNKPENTKNLGQRDWETFYNLCTGARSYKEFFSVDF